MRLRADENTFKSKDTMLTDYTIITLSWEGVGR